MLYALFVVLVALSPTMILLSVDAACTYLIDRSPGQIRTDILLASSVAVIAAALSLFTYYI